MEQTTVTLSMEKDEIQKGTSAVLEFLAVYPPAEAMIDEDFNLGVQVIFNMLRATLNTATCTVEDYQP